MINLSRLLLVIISCCTTSLVVAQNAKKLDEMKYYDVEVIVFKNVSVPRSQEFNLPTPSATRTKKTLDLSDRASIKRASQSGFTPLEANELRLNDSVKSIIKSSRYQLLLHTGWRQPGLDESSSIPVWVKGGKIFDSSYSSIDQMNPSNPGQDAGNTGKRKKGNTPQMQGLHELEGQITIILSRYLHTRTELVLRKPADVARIIQQGDLIPDSEEQGLLAMEGQLLLNYALDEQRRMRSKKLHYLDHPEFGMLVLITPYEAPEETVIQPEEATIPAANTPAGSKVVN